VLAWGRDSIAFGALAVMAGAYGKEGEEPDHDPTTPGGSR
jgi:hypothetical protein